MAGLAEIYIKVETLEKVLQVLKKKQEKGIGITVSVSDKSNTYGSNVSAYVTQSKEDREAKKEKFPIGFGKVFWTDGKMLKGEKQADTPQAHQPYSSTKTIIDDIQEDSLPF